MSLQLFVVRSYVQGISWYLCLYTYDVQILAWGRDVSRTIWRFFVFPNRVFELGATTSIASDKFYMQTNWNGCLGQSRAVWRSNGLFRNHCSWSERGRPLAKGKSKPAIETLCRRVQPKVCRCQAKTMPGAVAASYSTCASTGCDVRWEMRRGNWMQCTCSYARTSAFFFCIAATPGKKIGLAVRWSRELKSLNSCGRCILRKLVGLFLASSRNWNSTSFIRTYFETRVNKHDGTAVWTPSCSPGFAALAVWSPPRPATHLAGNGEMQQFMFAMLRRYTTQLHDCLYNVL